jgi:hypothetical protein
VIWIVNNKLLAVAGIALRNVADMHGVRPSAVRALLEAVKAFLLGCMFLVVVDRFDPAAGIGWSEILQAVFFAGGFLLIVARLLSGAAPYKADTAKAGPVLRTVFLFVVACILMAMVDAAYVALAAFAIFVHAERLVAFAAADAEPEEAA